MRTPIKKILPVTVCVENEHAKASHILEKILGYRGIQIKLLLQMPDLQPF